MGKWAAGKVGSPSYTSARQKAYLARGLWPPCFPGTLGFLPDRHVRYLLSRHLTHALLCQQAGTWPRSVTVWRSVWTRTALGTPWACSWGRWECPSCRQLWRRRRSTLESCSAWVTKTSARSAWGQYVLFLSHFAGLAMYSTILFCPIWWQKMRHYNKAHFAVLQTCKMSFCTPELFISSCDYHSTELY